MPEKTIITALRHTETNKPFVNIWTDHSLNFWWGCTEVSPGCDHCMDGGEHRIDGKE